MLGYDHILHRRVFQSPYRKVNEPICTFLDANIVSNNIIIGQTSMTGSKFNRLKPATVIYSSNYTFHAILYLFFLTYLNNRLLNLLFKSRIQNQL